MFSDTELEIAAIAYLRERGWSDEIIEIHSDTKAEVKARIKAAVAAVAKSRGEE